MLRKPHLAALFCLCTLPALSQQIDDPANLMGERVSAPSLADTLPINHGAPALEQLLRKLRTRASMMLIVAHPDDEDSGLLTLESRGMGARAAMLTLTRGEGGQNLMTGDFNDALGLIRTQELLAEDRYTGVDQFFGTEVDFGFSKTKEESFKQWTHERVLYDAVRAVRLYRPLVLASVFIGGVTDGHGQHQVSGEITQEVFLAAADPKVFPEMGLPPWAPLRVYARVPFAPITAQGMFDYATGKYLPPHFHNYVTGKDTTTPPQADVTIHEGEVPNIPAFEGKSYVQWARQGLALQKTQIGTNFRIPPAGRVDVGYTLYASRLHCKATNAGASCLDPQTWASAKATAQPAESHNSSADQDLFTGIDTSLPSIANLAPHAPATLRQTLTAIDAKTAEAQRLFNPAHPELTAAPLRDALKLLDTLISQVESFPFAKDERFDLLHELRIKRVQFNDALVLAHGLRMTASLIDPPASQPLLSTRTHILVSTTVSNGGSQPVRFNAVTLPVRPDFKTLYRQPHSRADLPLTPSSSRTDKVGSEFLPALPATRPYFSRADLSQPFYEVSNPALRNAPGTPAPVNASAFIDDQGVELELAATVADPAPPNQPIVVVPPVAVSLTRTSELPPSTSTTDRKANRPARTGASAGILPLDTKALHLGALLAVEAVGETVPNGPAITGTARIPVKLIAPIGWRVSAPAYNEHTEPVLEQFTLTPATLATDRTYRITAAADFDSQHYSESYRSVGYPGLTYTNYYSPATYKATAVNVTTAPDLHVAYLPGTGDDVPEFLPSLGVTPAMLSPNDLAAENLKQYDAVILGVRAYSAHPELEGAGSAALNEYARQGGIVIAQYNSGGFNPSSAPYPYTLPGDSAHNVVDEDQPVRLLAPEIPLLTWPNRITLADFDHWIEERGHGFASEWSPEYTPLLETHDLDQDPQKGGLLLAKTGKGAYIYCAFALYRELPEGVPGAYRLLANLLSYAKNPKR